MTANELPRAPGVRRKLRLRPLQALGVAVLIAIPVLALFGVFGRRTAEVTDPGELTVSARFPTRMRFKQIDRLEVTVVSGTGGSVKGRLRFERSYLDAMSRVDFGGASPVLDAGWYSVEIEVPPGGAVVLPVSIQAERPGRHQGRIELAGAGSRRTVEIATFIFAIIPHERTGSFAASDADHSEGSS